MKFIKEHSVFIIILVVCLVLRLIPLFDYQFTYDELSGLERTQFSSFGELIEKGVKVDAHPALVQVMIYYFSQWFGYVTWIIKLPFLLFGFGAVIYAYALGYRHFSKQVGLLAAVIFSFSLIFVFYAPIARMYISGVFFSLGLLYYFFEIFYLNENGRKNFFLLGLFGLLCAINQHINALFAFTVFVTGFFLLNKANKKPYLLTCALTIVAYLPNLPVTIYQLGLGGIGYEQGGWLDTPEMSALFTFTKVLLGTGLIYGVVLFFCLLHFILQKRFVLSRKQVFLLLIFLVNFFIVYLYSVYRAPVFQNSVMLFAGAGLVIFFCSMMDFKSRYVFGVCFGLLAALLIYRTYFQKDYYHQAVKTVFEYQFERTVHYKNKYGDKNVYPVFFDADAIMKKIYFSKYKASFDCRVSSDSIVSYGQRTYFKKSNSFSSGDSVISSVRLFSEFVAGLKSDYIALSSSTPLYECIVQEHFPFLLENTQTQGIYYKLYSRKNDDIKEIVQSDSLAFYRNGLNSSHPLYNHIRHPKPGAWYKIDSTFEFPYGDKTDYKKINPQEGQIWLARAMIEEKNIRNRELELCINTSKEKGESYAYSAKALSDFKPKEKYTVMYCDQFIGTQHKRITDSTFVNSYFWNRGKSGYTLYGFEAMLVDYWRCKWHFWD